MFWDRKKEGESPVDGKPHSTARPRSLTPELQHLVDREEELLDEVYEGHTPDTVDTNYRYSAYAARIRTILLSAHRYVAYTSEIGESFRPVAHPWLVRGAYSISWAYICGDVANEGYKAYLRNQRVLAPQCDAYRDATSIVPVEAEIDEVSDKSFEEHQLHQRHLERVKQRKQEEQNAVAAKHPMPWKDPEEDTLTPWNTMKIPLSEDYRSVMAERAVFQVLASMGLPALTIHTIVKYSGRAMKGMKSVAIRTWGPVGLGLSVVPLLPYVFDKPVEHAVQWSFHKAFLAIGGPDAVPHISTSDTVASKTLDAIQEAKQRRKEERQRRRAERRLRQEKEE